MAARRFVDFDAAWSARNAPPFVVKVRGVEHTLPPAMPAGLRLMLVRLQAENRATRDLTWEEVDRIARFLFADETVDGWHKARMTEDEVLEVVMTVIGGYALADPPPATEASDLGEAPAPASGA